MTTLAERNAQERIDEKIEQVKREFGSGVMNLLKAANRTHLRSRGKVTILPLVDRNNVRWGLSWKDKKMSYDLNIVVAINDDGIQARVDRVWVHRRVSTPFDFDGHTPTTHMRRLTSLAIAEIAEAIEAEFKK
jgi:hypothetical protein